MRTDAEVPEDVWTRVLDHSELEEVLALEQVRLLLVAIVTDADKLTLVDLHDSQKVSREAFVMAETSSGSRCL